MSGMQFGIAMGSLVFIPVALLPEAELLTWGWRVPFLLSGALTGLMLGILLTGFAPAAAQAAGADSTLWWPAALICAIAGSCPRPWPSSPRGRTGCPARSLANLVRSRVFGFRSTFAEDTPRRPLVW
jgi:hypothetical protein